MKTFYALFAVLSFSFCSFSSIAQTATEKNNVDYKKTNYEARASSESASQKKIKSPTKMMKEADFTLFSFPAKGSNYISVNNAAPNAHIKVIAYDVTGKLIFTRDYLANNFGQLVAYIDPMIQYETGTAFVAALYNNQAYYETMVLNK